MNKKTKKILLIIFLGILLVGSLFLIFPNKKIDKLNEGQIKQIALSELYAHCQNLNLQSNGSFVCPTCPSNYENRTKSTFKDGKILVEYPLIYGRSDRLGNSNFTISLDENYQPIPKNYLLEPCIS